MRRRLAVWLTAVFVLASGCAQRGADAPEGAAAQYRGDAHNTGAFEASGLPELAGERWSIRLGGKVFASPVLDGETLYLGDDDGGFYSISALDATINWTFKANNGIRSSATVFAGRIYFTDKMGELYALEKSTGRLDWSTRLDNKFAVAGLIDQWDYYGATPAVDGNTIYVGSEGFVIYALNRKDGSVKWSQPAAAAIHNKPVLEDGKLFYADKMGTVAALDQKTGEMLWSIKQGSMHGGLAYRDGVLYYGSRDQHVYATKADNGEVLWKHRSPGGSWIGSSAAVSESFVAIGASDSKVVHVFDREKGEHHLDFPLNSRVFASPAIAGEIMYFGSAYTDSRDAIDAFYAVDMRTGKELWRFAGTSEPILSSPVIGDGVVYFASSDGWLYALQ